MIRLRVTFSKDGALRYTGHLDLHQVWERTIRRAGLPLAYSQGFHPTPKIQLAAALPLGFIGQAEIMDMWLDLDEIETASIAPQLQSAAPPGLTVLSVEQVDERSPALQTQVESAEYEVTLLDPPPADLASHLSAIMEAASLPRERRGKAYDLRPLIEVLTLTSTHLLNSREGQGERVFMRLAAREGATGRPEEVLSILNIPIESARIERIRLLFRQDALE